MAKNTKQQPENPKQQLEDCRLIVPATESGKQGKSTVVGHIVEYVRHYHPTIKMRLFDPDTIHYSLWRAFGPAPTKTERKGTNGPKEIVELPAGASAFQPNEGHSIEIIDLTGDEGYVALDAAIESFADDVSIAIVDGVAQQFGAKFGAWARALDLDSLRKEYGFRVTFLLIVTEVSDTLTQAVDIMQKYGTNADYLIAKQQPRDGSLSDWDLPGAAPARALAEEVGARVIEMKKFRAEVMDAMNPAGKFAATPTLWSIYNGSVHKPLVRQRVRTDWVEIKGALDRAADVILPPAFVK